MKTGLIIPAAGLSSRFPPNKLLEKINGITAIEQTVSTCLETGLDIYVILGNQYQVMKSILVETFRDNISLVHNKDFEQGMASSVKAGIQAAGRDYDYWAFCPGDKPFILLETVDDLIRKLSRKRPLIMAPVYKKTMGHPTFFSTDLWEEMMEITGDEGGRSIMKKFMEETLFVEVDDEGTIIDMDYYLEKQHVR